MPGKHLVVAQRIESRHVSGSRPSKESNFVGVDVQVRPVVFQAVQGMDQNARPDLAPHNDEFERVWPPEELSYTKLSS